jgi:hypothetical protein
MKKVGILVALALVFAGSVLGVMALPGQAQVVYAPGPPPPPPPMRTAVAPWVGANTPWTFYNGDWFYNGMLYYFFGPKHGWAPYHAYAPTAIVRPAHWYGPRWTTWYQAHPVYWENFHRASPYWHEHRVGHRYDEAFYNRYHHGQGGGWQRGYYGQP